MIQIKNYPEITSGLNKLGEPVATIEQRVDSLEQRFYEMGRSNARIETKLNQVMETLSEIKGSKFTDDDRVAVAVERGINASYKDCANVFVSKSEFGEIIRQYNEKNRPVLVEEFSILWDENNRKRNNTYAKIVKGIIWALGVIITSVFTVVSGLAEYFK